MTTYPIFRATFGGSADYMTQPELLLASTDTEAAVEKFKRWDACTTGACGAIGRLIYKSTERGWFRPEEITEAYITLDKDIRATRLDWFQIQ